MPLCKDGLEVSMLVVSERWGGPAFVRPTYKGFFWYKAAAAGVAAAGRGLRIATVLRFGQKKR